METTFICPSCGRQALGAVQSGCPSNFICPHCLRSGKTVSMQEALKSPTYSMGDGLFTKKK